jgi:hypothetical protein
LESGTYIPTLGERSGKWKELDAKGSGIYAMRVGYWEEIEGKGSGIYTVREGFWYL